jgi:protein phosphatase
MDGDPMTDFGARTDVGNLRELNEDAVLASPPVFVVADGMGGHAAGEVASLLALQTIGGLAGRDDLRREDLLAAIEQANEAILAEADQQREHRGMGTTVSGVCLGSVGGAAHWFVFNVGDSRVYRFVDGTLTQITTDHSEVAELVALGRISEDEARSHPARNIVTRSLGTDPSPVPDIWVLPVVSGERFLICSDGLPLEVREQDIASILGSGSAQEAADRLVEAALSAGGRDNVSAVVVDVPRDQDAHAVDVATAPRKRNNGERS